MRLVYFGSGEFGVPTLEALRAQHEVVLVVTQPDRPAGRKRKLTATPVAQWAQQQGIAVLKAEDANDAACVAQVTKCKADAGVVIAFGQKLSPELLRAAGALTINLHASLLPKYRGAAPINWAMIEGESETGVSVIALASRMDAGVIYAQRKTPIDPLETAGELHDRLAAMGPEPVLDVLAQHEAGTLQGRQQDEAHATRAPKLGREDAHISFRATGREIRCKVHGMTPWPGVQVQWVNHEGDVQPLILRRVREEPEVTVSDEPGVLLEPDRVAVRDGLLHLLEVQSPGGKPMGIDEFLRGHRLQVGEKLRGQG